MGSDEDSVKEKLLSTNISPKNQSESESPTKKSIAKMNTAIIKNEKKKIESDDDDTIEGDLRLHDAVYGEIEDLEEIENLVADEPHLVFELDCELRSPLHTIAISG
jgi:hypothetical protein